MSRKGRRHRNNKPETDHPMKNRVLHAITPAVSLGVWLTMLLLILSDRITNTGPTMLASLVGTAACMVLTYNIASLQGILDNEPPRTP